MPPVILPIDDAPFLKWLSPRLDIDKALEPDDPLYEPLYANDLNDPIELIFADIDFKVVESLNFLSGFRGSGKTTELFRLRKKLQDDGYFVAYANALDYVSQYEPVEISDFLIVLAGAFSEAVEAQLKFEPTHEGWWTRFVNYLTRTEVKLDGVELKAGTPEAGVNFKTSLKTEPSFRQKVRQKMVARLGELKAEVRTFFADTVAKAKKLSGTAKNVVFIFDQLEQLRDEVGDTSPVADSVTSLIANHKDDLKIPSMHCVYTVPPWLKFKLKGFLSSLLYNVKLSNNDADRTANPDGLKTMRSIVERRFTAEGIRRFFGDRQADGSSALVDKLIRASGGHFRDLLRLLHGALLRARKQQRLPINPTIVDSAIVNVQSSFLPIPVQDARWLNKISQTRDGLLEDDSPKSVHQMTVFLDTHCVMIHRNGKEWYDIHPIIRDEVAEIVKRNPPAPEAAAPK